MAIHQYLKNISLNADEAECLVEAFAITLKSLRLSNRDDPITEMVARKVFEVSKIGVRDPIQLSKLVLKTFEPEVGQRCDRRKQGS
jgi:hypothetical protein